jgi:cysteinyl-tRNA synthetase
VTYVRNITDVDDKIINRARGIRRRLARACAKYTAAMHEDLDKLGCLRPEKEPKASEYIDEMLTMIGQLITNGYAYQATNGDVMYDVHKFAPYGKLSGKKLEDSARRFARGSGHGQARSARLRVVEVREARRASVAVTLG